MSQRSKSTYVPSSNKFAQSDLIDEAEDALIGRRERLRPKMSLFPLWSKLFAALVTADFIDLGREVSRVGPKIMFFEHFTVETVFPEHRVGWVFQPENEKIGERV